MSKLNPIYDFVRCHFFCCLTYQALEILRGGSSSDYFMLKLSTGCRTLDQHLRGVIDVHVFVNAW